MPVLRRPAAVRLPHSVVRLAQQVVRLAQQVGLAGQPLPGVRVSALAAAPPREGLSAALAEVPALAEAPQREGVLGLLARAQQRVRLARGARQAAAS